MASPAREPPASSPQPIPGRSDSPVRVRTESPIRHRHSISVSPASADQPRLSHSPTLTRVFNLNDPDVRERQRALDVDMAIHMARARSHTISSPTGQVSPFHPPAPGSDTTPLAMPTPLAPGVDHLPSFSEREEREFDTARLGGALSTAPSEIGPEDAVALGLPQPATLSPNLTHDLTLSPIPHAPTDSEPFLPTYQQHALIPDARRPSFDFALMEEYALAEKTRLGLDTPASPGVRWRDFTVASKRPRTAAAAAESPVPTEGTTADDNAEAGPSSGQPRLRQRKLSQSTAGARVRRPGAMKKMALFEAGAIGAPPPSFTGEPVTSAMSSFEQLPHQSLGAAGGQGHDRPYRFSFYSNTLSATIHARSLAELPAEGQTFEELFTGLNHQPTPGGDSIPASFTQKPDAMSSKRSSAQFPGAVPGYAPSGLGPNASANGNGNGSSSKTGLDGGALGEQSTWWLDVMSPTDEEMKMLSKVFSIHPLTTEDIQMEETREKIELFRNYYLVCFRSFDQDPYSPMYLEPLNMYIIVFREGILSFHFRATPHPQNVRRRIKQLKDYISVTSDWISYALIDDITDAFGPLIQSIEYEVDSIDELVLILKEAEQSDMLRRIGTCRKKVMGLLRLMGNKADVVKGLAKRCNENWRVAPTSDIGLYLSDIQDHLITMTQNLNHYEKILSRSHSNYLAQISIEMTDANNQINDVLSKMTALGTVLIPMNLITGLWGMNVNVPGQNAPGLAWFFSILCGLCAFAALGGYITFRLMRR